MSPYLAHLLALPLDPQEAGPVERLDPQARHARYIDSLEALLRAIARSAPLVLACEDVHWADESSIEALASLLPLAAEGRLLVLLTSRPDPETPGWGLMTGARLLAGESPAELRLGALSEDESRTLVSALLEIESLPGDVRSFILGRAEGNPFFVEEVIRMLIETGVIEERAHKWVAREGVASPRLPQTLHSLLLARIDRLPDDARHLLRVASVVGREFNVRVLAGVEGDREVEELLPALDVLQAYDLVRPSPDPATHYLFRHVLVQEAVYDSILQRDRTTLHIAVAEALQHMYPDRRSEMAGLLALHFERAGEIERAVDLLLEAGGQALLRFANKEALGFFARARLHLAGETRDPVTLRRRVMSGLGAARAGRTFTPHSQEVAILEALLPDAEALGDQRLLAETHLGIARARHAQGEIPGTSAALRRSMRRAEEIAAALGDDPLRGLPLMLNGLSQFVGSRFRKAGALFREAVPLLEAAAWYEDAAYASGLAAISSARLGEWGTAETWSLRQAELAERSGDPNALLDADIHRGLVESERGNVEEAIELGRRGAEAAEQVDNKACAVVGHFLVGSEHFRSGRPEAAIEALERSTEIAQYCDLADVENLSRALLSAARSQLGRGEEALGELAVALARAREIGDRLGEGEILRHRAAVRARTTEPDWKAVDADFRASIAVFEDLETRPYLARALRAYASALEAQGRMAEARELLRSTRTESGDG